jgi:NIMA (never in mitosis gene a)-related kinase
MNPRKSEFKKVKELGSGSFGTVHLVRRLTDGAEFALKKIKMNKPGLKEQAMKEVETMMELPPHPNIVRLHDHWVSADHNSMWMLLEYALTRPSPGVFL